MKEFYKSKNFIITLLIVGSVFLLITVVQLISIISLNLKNDDLNSKHAALYNQQKELTQAYNQATGDGFIEDFAKNENNMKNEDETIYKGE